jgi:mono/diheme cytochrome c family protein
VASLLSSKCLNCHGTRRAGGAPMSLTNYAQMTAPAISDSSKTMAVVAVSRMMDTTNPMPPPGYPAVTSTEIAAVQNWISAGYPTTGCSSVTPPATSSDAGTLPPDPFAVAPTCTSGKTWTGGTNGSGSMQPGVACINCHKSTGGEAPTFTIAGTLYPTAHEPDQCNGVNGTTAGAQVVITDAKGNTFSITPNSVGNFSSSAPVALPFTAKVTYMGRERDMVGSQTSGDCNACHTQNGTTTTTNGSPAPGRIILP